MKSVAQILYSGLGGHGSVAFSLINADTNSQWQPLVGFLGIEPLLPAYADRCEEKGIPYEYFPAIPGKPWRSWPCILQWLNQTQPNAVILHSVTALLPCWWYARTHKAALIVVEHQPNALKKPSEWVVSRLAMWLADAVVVLTPAYRQELQDKLGIFYRHSKIKIIPNGVDLSRYTPVIDSTRHFNTTVRLGMAARFTETKRQDALIRMMVQLRRQQPTIDWHLSLAGNGETWERIQTMVAERGLHDCISLPGHLGEDELIAWFQSLDIYLHASSGETLSTSLLQAMAMGLPIVASDVPGIDNLLSGEMDCGVLVKNSTPEGFAKAVVTIMYDKGNVKRLTDAARQRVVEDYSQEAMFEGYSSLLDNAL